VDTARNHGRQPATGAEDLPGQEECIFGEPHLRLDVTNPILTVLDGAMARVSPRLRPENGLA
jgi:hypothetical protein